MCYSGRIIDDFWWNYRFLIFRQISQVRIFNNFQFLNYHTACKLWIKNDPNQAKDLINIVSVTLEVLRMISDRIVDFRFFVKFHRSGPAIIFSFGTITEHVSYESKKLLIKQKISSTWCVLQWKDYGWFLIELSICNFSWNFTSPEMQ